jgi:predicted O-linked N-acetylglucosamine transferase (SPINDLY family)
LDEAIEAYRRAFEIQPDYAGAHSNLILTALYHPGCDAAAVRKECERWENQHGVPRRRFIRPHENDANPRRRLKVGYVSPDFFRSAVSNFLLPLLEAHDHAGFEIHCYASVRRPDAVTARLKKCADVWRDASGVRDDVLAEMIREDRIDILVDLTLHGANNRLLTFAQKPAPVQIAWLGHPGGTGLQTMDHRLSDACLEPEGSDWSASVEETVRLPDSWFCYDPIDEFPEPGELPALSAGHVTFACLNPFCKINDAVLRRWSAVLSAVERSKLLLRCPEGETRQRVRQFLGSLGIAAERVDCVPTSLPRADYLRLFQQIDIALDPFPYNGGTTTCETLWMGVPVLTQPGKVTVSRIGLSILSAAGMPEFVAQSEAGYVRLAAGLAHDLPHLARLRGTLRERMKASPLMDGPRFAGAVEAAFRQMWSAWCAKRCSNPQS